MGREGVSKGPYNNRSCLYLTENPERKTRACSWRTAMGNKESRIEATLILFHGIMYRASHLAFLYMVL